MKRNILVDWLNKSPLEKITQSIGGSLPNNPLSKLGRIEAKSRAEQQAPMTKAPLMSKATVPMTPIPREPMTPAPQQKSANPVPITPVPQHLLPQMPK